MSCFPDEDLVKAELGDLSLNHMATIEAHLAECSRCERAKQRIRRMMEHLGSPPELGNADAFVKGVMAARLDVATPAATERSRHGAGPGTYLRWLSAAAALVLAAGLAKTVFDGKPRREYWAARGGHGESQSPARRPTVDVLVVRDHGLVDPADQNLSSTDAIAVRYTNQSDKSAFLSVFAMDAAGEVHWIYPEYLDATKDPWSVALPVAERAQLLPEVVTPEHPAQGPFRVVAMISSAPTSVKHIERAIQGLTASDSPSSTLVREFPSAQIREWSCQWNAP